MSKYKLVPTIVVLLFLVSSSAELIAQDVAEVLESVKAKQQGVKCVWYKVEGTMVFPKGSASENPKFPGFPLKDVVKPFSTEVLIDFEHGRYQLHVNRYGVSFLGSKASIEDDFYFSIYENERLGCHWLATTKRKTEGLLDPASQEGLFISDARGHLDMYIVPFIAVHGFLPNSHFVDRSNPFGQDYKRSQFSHGGMAVLDGNECHVLVTSNTDSDMETLEKREYWIHQARVVRIADYFPGSSSPDDVLTITYTQKSGIMVPDKFERILYQLGSAPEIQQIMQYRVTGFENNPEYEDRRKDFDLYPGMLWRDENNNLDLIVDEKLQLVSQTDSDVGTPSRRGTFFKWLVVSVGVILCLAVSVRVFSLINKRRN